MGCSDEQQDGMAGEVREEWRDCGADGLQASDLGRVRSRRKRNGQPLPPGGRRVCSLSVHSSGYLCVSTGGGKTELVHRLVMEAFSGPRPAGYEVRHLNGDRTDNRVENLAWGTHAENCRDTVRHGRGGKQRLSPEQVGEIRRRLRDGATDREVGRDYDVSPKTVNNIRRGATWGWLPTAQT